MELVTEPTAHLSTDPRDVYNNIVLFVVREDRRAGHRPTTPTEMHIFQCNRVSANEVVDDMRAYLAGQFQRVRVGRRDTGFIVASPIAPSQQQFYSNNNSGGSARGGDSIVNG
jgi:epidermal growth factor receptor kinase substrate 8